MSKNSLKCATIFSALVLSLICAAGVSYGQDQPATAATNEIEDVPPPIIALSKMEAEQLRALTDLKDRTRLCLQFAESRLQRAQTLTDNAEFYSALNELAGYQAVVDEGIKFLQNLREDTRKVRDNLRRLEIAVRGHIPRIESIRRSTPLEYGVYIKEIMTFARDSRTRALNSFFSDTVLAESTGGGGIKPASTQQNKSPNNGFTTEKKP